MRQAQKNLFFSYRGPRQPDGSLDRQLEDNVTKALVNVLEHSSREHILEPFLRTLCQLRGRIPPEEVQFAIQRVDIARPTVRTRIALALAPDPGISPRSGGNHRGSRPDAWIWADERFAVLVEAKVRGSVTRDQVQRHIRGATGWKSSNSRIVPRTWGQVYRFLSDVRRHARDLDLVSSLLVKEFLRYLRMTALASDTTFDLDDFGYFLLAPADRDAQTRALLGRKLRRFSEELAETRALRRIIRRYNRTGDASTVVNPGVFGKKSENCWITIGLKERRNQCHFTIRLQEDGISLEAFSPHKSFTRKLISKIEREPARFLSAIAAISRREPFVLRLREAYFKNPRSSYKGQSIGLKVDFLEVHPRELTRENVIPLVVNPVRDRLSERAFRPEVFLVRHFRLSEIVGNEAVVRLVADAAEKMLDYFSFATEL